MIRDVDLVAYLPPVIADFKELDITLTAENPEFVLVWKAADRVLRNEFIFTADEFGIERFEKILNILPAADDTLEIRRARVQAKWFTVLPYTWRMFVQKVTEICGTDYPVTITQKESYMIKLEAGIELQWQIDSLIDIAEKMLPCNMGLAIKNVLPVDLETSAPIISPDWFGYTVEYRGEIITNENSILIKTLRMNILVLFWGGALYNGKHRHDGRIRYNAKRNYGLRVKLKTILELYTEQAVKYTVAFAGYIQYKTNVDMFMEFLSQIRYKEFLSGAICMHTVLQSPSGDVCNISVETRRNVVRYNNARRYNGAMRYNALHRKETVE